MKPTTSCECTVACLLYTFACTPAMQYGRDNEPKAIERLETDKGVNVKKCGLFVDREYPYLAATPDGLVGEDTVVEVKCPENSKDLTPLEGVQKKKDCVLRRSRNRRCKNRSDCSQEVEQPLVPGSRAAAHHGAHKLPFRRVDTKGHLSGNYYSRRRILEQ